MDSPIYTINTVDEAGKDHHLTKLTGSKRRVAGWAAGTIIDSDEMDHSRKFPKHRKIQLTITTVSLSLANHRDPQRG